ncbi:MAG: hypothetical protein OK456_10615 [Thaumarchaeota archaeon]|nr:hypothetical protein [Nitrososphaerota archaeon]
MALKGNEAGTDGGVVWEGRPAIGVYVAIYAVIAVVAAGILIGLELYTARSVSAISNIFYHSLVVGPLTIPDAIEFITGLVVLIIFLAKLVGLVLLRASNSYQLRTDGLYVNKGIANLSNTFISAMAFSDAKLTRTIGMRMLGRGRIVVEANDGRRFELKLLKDSANVQALIRSNLSHPTVRIEK